MNDDNETRAEPISLEDRIESLKAEHRECSKQIAGLKSSLRNAERRKDRIEAEMREVVGLPPVNPYGNAEGLLSRQRAATELAGAAIGTKFP